MSRPFYNTRVRDIESGWLGSTVGLPVVFKAAIEVTTPEGQNSVRAVEEYFVGE